LITVEVARIRNKFIPYVTADDIQKSEQVLLLHERKELTEKSVCDFLGVLDAQLFLRRLMNIS